MLIHAPSCSFMLIHAHTSISEGSRTFTIFFIAVGMITIYGILTTRMQERAMAIESRFLNQTFMLSERVHEITRQLLGLFYYALSLGVLTLVGAAFFVNIRNPGTNNLRKYIHVQYIHLYINTCIQLQNLIMNANM